MRGPVNWPMNWHDVTAVFGGTFDPPHLGHREAVAGLFKNPGVSRALVTPSFIPPQKPQAVASEHRVAMAKLCFASLPEVVIDTREIERGKRTGQPSFTFETLEALKKDYPQIAFTLGSDQLQNLPTWHRFPEILGLCNWIVLTRKPDGERQAMETLTHWQAGGLVKKENQGWKTPTGTHIGVFETPAREISSRNIREKLSLVRLDQAIPVEVQTALPPEILSYLMEHCIYGTRSHTSFKKEVRK
jgi:nicotinate-nucleotide adenylyltransferase